MTFKWTQLRPKVSFANGLKKIFSSCTFVYLLIVIFFIIIKTTYFKVNA